jgi:putative endonuclease
MYYLYVLKSLKEEYSNIPYIGITNNLEKRLEMHNLKKGAKATRRLIPVEYALIIDGFNNRSEASSIESKIKNIKKKNKKYSGLENTIKLIQDFIKN